MLDSSFLPLRCICRLFVSLNRRVNAATVISAYSLRTHQNVSVCTRANVTYRLCIHGIQMCYQHYRRFALHKNKATNDSDRSRIHAAQLFKKFVLRRFQKLDKFFHADAPFYNLHKDHPLKSDHGTMRRIHYSRRNLCHDKPDKLQIYCRSSSKQCKSHRYAQNARNHRNTQTIHTNAKNFEILFVVATN